MAIGKSEPVNIQGFYGQGNSALDPMKEKDEPVVNPKGKFLVKRLEDTSVSFSLTTDEIQGCPWARCMNSMYGP